MKNQKQNADASAAKKPRRTGRKKKPVQKERAFAPSEKNYLDFELIIASDTLFGVSAYCLNSIV